MIDEILPGVFRLEVPLPRNPLKALNSYVIKASGRNMIIDTAMNREECRSATAAGLSELEVDLRETDFFITHMHADHSGLLPSLVSDSSTVYGSQPDADRIKFDNLWPEMREYARANGFCEGELQEAIDRHPANRFGAYGAAARNVTFTIVKDGDRIAIGDYSFRCVETPGHTRGHVCLYEPDRKLLVAGDHILDDITPNISLWTDQVDALKEYLASLDKVYQLDVELTLPGHRRLITDCRERIRQLRRHHQMRLDETLSILEKGAMDAYRVASKMTWDMSYESWEQFPVAQKWFATGEAIAHLRYLQGQGLIQREIRDGKAYYSR